MIFSSNHYYTYVLIALCFACCLYLNLKRSKFLYRTVVHVFTVLTAVILDLSIHEPKSPVSPVEPNGFSLCLNSKYVDEAGDVGIKTRAVLWG